MLKSSSISAKFKELFDEIFGKESEMSKQMTDVFTPISQEDKKHLEMLKRYKDIHAGDGKPYRLQYDLKSTFPIWKRVDRIRYIYNSKTLFMKFTVSARTPLFFSIRINSYFFVKPVFKKCQPDVWECTHGAMHSGIEISGFGNSMEEAYKEFIFRMTTVSSGDFIHVNSLLKKHQ